MLLSKEGIVFRCIYVGRGSFYKPRFWTGPASTMCEGSQKASTWPLPARNMPEKDKVYTCMQCVPFSKQFITFIQVPYLVYGRQNRAACRVLIDQASGPGSVPIAGQACGDYFVALQHWRLRISCRLHDHVNGGVVSLWVGHKGTTKDGKLTGSDHPECPSIRMCTAYTCRVQWLGLSPCHLAPCHWARHFTCMCACSAQEWMGYLVGQWLPVCLNIVSSVTRMAGAVCSPGSWVGTGTNRSHNQENSVKRIETEAGILARYENDQYKEYFACMTMWKGLHFHPNFW